MKIYGKVSFKDSVVSNTVTVEGARTIINSLMNNSMGFISNILFITDADKLLQLRDAIQDDNHRVTWDILRNGGSPLYNAKNALGITIDPDDKSGTIYLTDAGESASVLSLNIRAFAERGVLPQDGLSVYAMCIILNGSGQRIGQEYQETGNERVLAFVDKSTQLYNNVDNEFRWTVYFDVSK